MNMISFFTQWMTETIGGEFEMLVLLLVQILLFPLDFLSALFGVNANQG